MSPVAGQPHSTRRKLLSNALERLVSEFNINIAWRIPGTSPFLDTGPVHSEKPENFNEDSAKFVKGSLFSLSPALGFHAKSATPRLSRCPDPNRLRALRVRIG